ncbi:MAG: hypothetical protein D3925_00665 [Candidatus Electrothrix sp. AR5]|nr:hypothetical protein [Candidatus Electrothrix sp. AR5]
MIFIQAFFTVSIIYLAAEKKVTEPLLYISARSHSLGNLFDRNTDIAYVPASPALIDVPFEGPQTINEIRVYGLVLQHIH